MRSRSLTCLCLMLTACSALVEGRLPNESRGDGGQDSPSAAGSQEGGADASSASGDQAGTDDGGQRADGSDGAVADGGGGGDSGNAEGDGGDDGGPSAREQLQSCASKFHGCVLDGEGRLQCIGTANQEGRLDVPDGAYAAVACGDAHTCGVFDNGDMQCWGSNAKGQRVARRAAPDGRRYLEVAAGAEHSCGLDDAGDVTCWGADDRGQSTPPAGVRFSAIAASGHYTCGLRQADSIAQCWGWSSGNRLNAPQDQPFVALSLEDKYGCGLRDDGKVRCWGAVSFAGDPGIEGERLITNAWLVCALDGTRLDCDSYDLSAQALYSDLREDPWVHAFGAYQHLCVVPAEGPMVCHTLDAAAASALDSDMGVVLP